METRVLDIMWLMSSSEKVMIIILFSFTQYIFVRVGPNV